MDLYMVPREGFSDPWFRNAIELKMGCKNYFYEKARNLLTSPTMKESFHLFTITLLSLLLPLSFLLVARLSYVNYILNANIASSNPSQSFLWSIYFYTNPALLFFLVASISIATLVHGLTGKISTDIAVDHHRPRLYIAWIVLWIFQVSVGLGIEGSIESGITDGAGFGVEQRSLLSRVIFFLGLHEVMLLWFRTVVKPVVDDTVYGGDRAERWIHRASIALSVGTFWWWKLRDEVESLVVVAEAKKELSMEIKMGDFLGWWLYYLTVTIGMVRVVKALLSLGIVFLCRRVIRRNSADEISGEEDQDKV